MADGVFNYSQQLYNVSAKTASENGEVYEIKPVRHTDIDQSELELKAWCVVTTTGGASSPTADLVIETSADAVNWYTWDSITQITTATTSTQFLSTTDKVFFRYVRARLALGGGTAPTTTARVLLCSNGKFTLEAV